jgi:hypothetical protein
MAKDDYTTLTLFDDYPPHQLHMLAGWWTASCAVCGYTVASDKRQDRCEREARHTPCPVCNPTAA